MDFYEKEMRKMFEKADTVWDKVFVGKTMLGKLDDNKVIKLEFTNTHVGGKYNAILLSVINRNEGVVDKNTIRFSEVIGTYKFQSGNDSTEYYMWEYNGKPEWFVEISNLQRTEIAEKVMEYAKIFQDQGINNANMLL